jgi:hypothetical protein
MKKISLDLETLAVESFEITADSETRGTVKGQEDVGAMAAYTADPSGRPLYCSRCCPEW